MANRFAIETIFTAKERMIKPIKKTRQELRNLARVGRRGFNQLNRSVDKFNAQLKTVALRGGVALGVLSAGMGDVIKTGAEFEKTLTSAGAKFGLNMKENADQMKLLEGAARDAGATTEFSASEAASGLNFMAMAGFTAEQAIASLPGVIDLATASEIGLAEATDIASDTLSAFGLTSADSAVQAANLARVNDVLAATTTSANTDMQTMFETIKKAGSQAFSSGASIETLAALTGELANNAVKGSEAGSALKNVFLRLSAPTKAASKLIKKYGGDVVDSNGDLKDVIGIMGSLEEGLEGLGSAEKAEILNTIFGSRAINAVNILLKKGSKGLGEYRKRLEDSTGASKEMANVMRDTVQGRIDTANSSFESLKLTLFGLKKVGVGGLLDSITVYIRKVDTWIGKNEELAATIIDDLVGSIVAAVKLIGGLIAIMITLKLTMITIGVVTKAVSAAMWLYNTAIAINTALQGKNVVVSKLSIGQLIAYKTALLGAKVIMWLWNTALIAAGGAMKLLSLAMMANPIGLIIGLIGLLIGAVALLVLNWESVSGFFVDLWAGIKESFTDGIKFITDLMDSITAPFSSLFAGVIKVKQAISSEGEAGDGSDPGGNPAKLVTQSEQISESFSERRDTLGVEINDNTGKAKITNEPTLGSTTVSLQSSGGA